MSAGPRALLGRAKRQVSADLRRDPYLPYVLLLAALLSLFWFWHRIPNFATRDEKSRLLDAMVAYGRVIEDPSLDSLSAGVRWGRVPFGATLYLFGLAILPVVLAAAVLGQVDQFASLGFPSYAFGFYGAWQSMPRWVWTASIALVRLCNVAFAVGSVYLTYRLGTAISGRRLVGDLAALFLSLSFGFLTIAHEGGEDMPALFFVLLALYLVYRYVATDEGALFLAGAAAGGIAIAFKLTAAPIVVVIGAAFLLRAHRAGEDWRATLWRPRLFLAGALTGLACILLGIPTALVGGFDAVVERIVAGSAERASHTTGPDAPIWWWFLRGYLSGLSLPLFVAGVLGVLASVATLGRRRAGTHGTALLLVALGTYVLLFSRWHDFRVHHLLPTFPLLALLLADRLAWLDDHRPTVARTAVALLVLTSGAYAAVGVAGYASMPRDEAEDWLVEHAAENATVEVYRVDLQDTAVPYEMQVNSAGDQLPDRELDPCPEYVQLGYRDLLFRVDGTYYRSGDFQGRYVTNLLEGAYNYEVVAEFGPRPPGYVPERAEPGSVTDLLRYGVVPQTDQYADEQELAPNQFTVILERQGECTGDREIPPFW